MPYFLTYLSMARLMVIIFPFDTKFKSKSFVSKCLVVAFSIFATGTVIITLLLHIRGTIPSNLCLPFINPSDSVIEIKIATWLVLLFQCSAIALICLMYAILIKEVIKKLRELGQSRKLNKATILQLIILTGSNLICWLPSSITYLSSLHLSHYSTNLLVWTTTAIVPVNSIINPAVFIFTFRP